MTVSYMWSKFKFNCNKPQPNLPKAISNIYLFGTIIFEYNNERLYSSYRKNNNLQLYSATIRRI